MPAVYNILFGSTNIVLERRQSWLNDNVFMVGSLCIVQKFQVYLNMMLENITMIKQTLCFIIRKFEQKNVKI